MNPQSAFLVSTAAFGLMTYAILLGKKDMFRNLRKGRLVFQGTALLSGAFTLLNSMLLLDSLNPQATWASGGSIAIHYLGILVLAATGVILLRSRIVVEHVSLPKRVLAIGAHPDDLEIACGATLSKMRDQGYMIYGLTLTRGEFGGNPAERHGEAQRGASFIGFDIIEVRDYADTRLAEESNEIRATIEEIVHRFKPDIIFTHSANDHHQDHIAVHEATMRAARNHSTILCYESPSVTRTFSPTVFIDISKHLDVKIESIRQHYGQRSKPYVQGERVRGTAVYRGGQAKTQYAEAFEAVRLLSTSFGDV